MVTKYIEEDENGKSVIIFDLNLYKRWESFFLDRREYNMERIKESLNSIETQGLYYPQKMPSTDYGRIPSEADY